MSDRTPASDAEMQDLPFANVGAVVLAGGMARRMGGVDKGLVSLAGRPMAAYAVQTLLPVVSQLVINANRHAADYASMVSELDIQVIADDRTGYLGPLAGLSVALEHLPTRYVVMCPCDSPFLQQQLIIELINGCQQADADIAVAHDGQRLQPVFCVVHRRIQESLNAFLDSGERKIDRWFTQHATVEVDAQHFAQSFRNINTEEELAHAEKELLS